MSEAEITVMCFVDGGRAQDPKNADGHQIMEKARKWILQKEPVLPTPELQPSETDNGLIIIYCVCIYKVF